MIESGVFIKDIEIPISNNVIKMLKSGQCVMQVYENLRINLFMIGSSEEDKPKRQMLRFRYYMELNDWLEEHPTWRLVNFKIIQKTEVIFAYVEEE